MAKLSYNKDWRDKVEAGQLIGRLRDHAQDKIEMTSTQIRAAEIVLRKIIPDLKSMELTGEGGGPLQIEIVNYDKTKTSE